MHMKKPLFMNSALLGLHCLHPSSAGTVYTRNIDSQDAGKWESTVVTQLCLLIAIILLRCRPRSHCVESYRVDNVLGASIYSVALVTNLAQIAVWREAVICKPHDVVIRVMIFKHKVCGFTYWNKPRQSSMW